MQAARKAEDKPVPVRQWGEEYMQRLTGRWQDFLQLDLANSTHRAYGWHQDQFRQFCRLAGLPERPTERAVAQFVVGRAQHGYALSTIEQGVYALARWALDLGVEGLAGTREVTRAMKVAAKLRGSGVRQKLPLDRRDLRYVVYDLASLGDAHFIGVRDRALFLLGWAGMFRSSELVAVRWQDLHFTGSRPGVMVYVPRSKTDQAGDGAWVFVAGCVRERQLCPVQALERLRDFYRRRLGVAPLGSVFRAVAPGVSGAERQLAKSTVGVRLKKALAAVGVADADLYAAHSLRRGGATWAVQQGVSVREVQIMGRWKSDVVREYLYSSPSVMWAASARQQRG